ncbi:MAG: DEAD/DEAH box helicase family protein [Acidobacteriota bacterium]
MALPPKPGVRGHDELLDELRQEEARLAAIEERERHARQRVEALKAEIAEVGEPPSVRVQLPPAAPSAVPTTPSEKVALFRALFRGREEIYPRLWTNPKTGRSGYAPACFNEWVRGICDKPRVRCGECPNQRFIPVADQVILDHLKGKHVVGVYPLLMNETCWFLAADFDGDAWRADIAAFARTCRDVGLPVSIERSRSGDGAHAWFFFSAPVAASEARAMGCYLLTETISRRHQLSLRSYDRLFPSQDTMPKGGFGNLIALPLQHGPRQKGNTLFLDDTLSPHADQWSHLASVAHIDPEMVGLVAHEAARHGKVLGVQLHESEEDAAAPWARLPSRKPRRPTVARPLPLEIPGVMGQQLFIPREGLPPAVLAHLKRLAAFQNPEFYKKQALRLSTAMVPRIIGCAEDQPSHLALPRGCQEEVASFFREYGVTLSTQDERQTGSPLDVRFEGELTQLQKRAARAMLAHDIGILSAPPGVGKTVLGAYLIARRARSTLVLVHRQPLLDQWKTQLAMFLGVSAKDIGQIGSGKRKPNGTLDVATIQSLVRKGNVEDVVAQYGHVVVDECHHVPAVSFERVLREVKSRFITGLTATPYRRDGHHPILHMQLGPIRFAVDPRQAALARPFDQRLIVRETGYRDAGKNDASIQDLYRRMAADAVRNRLIVDDVRAVLREGRTPIVLTERRDHLEMFAAELATAADVVVVLHGGMSVKDRRAALTRLGGAPDTATRLVLATGRYIGEGFDDARLDTLFLAMPISWRGTLVQYAGRLHRLHPSKREVRIIDYVDRDAPMMARMFEKRLRTYRAIGYARGQAPLGFAEPEDSTEPDAVDAVDVLELEMP